MSDVLDRLKTALADRYTIEREIGSGGMATVYLAEDLKHHRQVAIKVLRPDLAATLGPERFLREIEVAANLTHPHILPLHDSGEADGFLFYVMPYIEGQSLRDKLAREGELPIGEAVRIIRDVVDALTEAHAHGVVHRDIKPENILLRGRHALVTDFGVAKAVSEATGREKLTTAGIALGTPAYMAPEQAAADPHLDHRVDIYAVGAVAYELLTGRPVFMGTTPQMVLSAHVTEAPQPVTKHRDTVPTALESVVMRCLEKKPADRFQSAEELLPQLEALSTPSGGMTPTDTRPLAATTARRRRLVPAMLVAAVAVTVVGYVTFRYLQVGAPGTLIGQEVLAEHDLILVIDFENPPGDSLLGATVGNGIRVELQQSGVVRVMGEADMRRGLRRMGVAPGVEWGEEVARELAEREGAKAYVAGDVSRLGAGYQLTARVVATLDETVVLSERVTADGDQELIAAVDDLGKRLRRGIGESLRAVRAAPPLSDVTTASLPALRAYVAAIRADDAGNRPQALSLLSEAVTLDSTFAAAWTTISILHYNSGRFREYSDAIRRAFLLRDRLPEVERLWVSAMHHKAEAEYAQSEAAYRQLMVLEPRRASHWINLAAAKLLGGQLPEAESLSLEALEIDSLNSVAYWNAAEAQIAQRRFVAVDSLTARMAAVLPGNSWTVNVRVNSLWARKDFGAVRAFVDSIDESGGQGALQHIVDETRCRLAQARGRVVEWRRCGYVGGVPALWELRYPGDTVRAGDMVDSMLALDPRPYPSIITVLAELGRLPEAHQLLDEWRDAFGPDDREYLTDVGVAVGSIALAEGYLDSARTAFLAWNTSGFPTATQIWNRGLAEAANVFDRAGRPDSAIALYERALAMPSILGHYYEAIWYAHALRRLGELHESLGHREEAIDYYGQFIDLWRNADPVLQSQVEEARTALARLTGEAR